MTSSAAWASSPRRRDAPLAAALRAAAWLAGAVCVLVGGFLVAEAWPALRVVGSTRLLLDPTWRPADGRFGLGAMLAATAACALGAVLLAAPLGVLAAAYARFVAPARLAGPLRRALELLNGVPSVVFGLWGLTALVPRIAAVEPPGASLFAAVLVLALMVVPTVAATADAALGAVPDEVLHGAAALGLGRATTVLRVALPAAADGIGAGVLLAAGRAVGETMAVLMVAGNVVRLPSGLFEPVRTVTANVALEMGYAEGLHRSALFAGGALLLAALALVVLLADPLARRRRRA